MGNHINNLHISIFIYLQYLTKQAGKVIAKAHEASITTLMQICPLVRA